ncbi:MAG: hypothetical protein ABIT08_01815 [Bacteroidia bacterium]
MSYRIIDLPHYVSESGYMQTLNAMVKRLAALPETISVYQVGSISSPGISDLDMIVVFKDNQKVEQNFLGNLSTEEKYLFVHNLYGISERDFADVKRFTFFNNFTLLYGTDTRTNPFLSPENTEVLKKQVAIEYLIRMCITVYLQQSYRVLRVRDLLLHVKALQYDCEFLGIHSGRLVEKISEIIEWRKNWFSHTPSTKSIINWWNEFYKEFELFIKSLFENHKFYLPGKTSYLITNNISVVPSKGTVRFSRKGFVLPVTLSFLGKRYFRIQNKLNQFSFEVPVTSDNIPSILENKFEFEKKYFEYNRKFLPNFFTLTMNLHVH